MQARVEVGELHTRVSDDRVIFVVHADQGNIELSLSPLAAHNLGVVLPHLTQEAAENGIVAIMAADTREDNR